MSDRVVYERPLTFEYPEEQTAGEEEKKKEEGFLFKIRDQHRDLSLKAASREDMVRWMRGLIERFPKMAVDDVGMAAAKERLAEDLYKSVLHGDGGSVEYLLALGADPNKFTDKHGGGALAAAVHLSEVTESLCSHWLGISDDSPFLLPFPFFSLY